MTWKTATLSFKSLKELCERMSEKALESFLGEVSVRKASTGLGVDERSPLATAFRFSGLRAKTAIARFPCDGWARILQIPAPLVGP